MTSGNSRLPALVAIAGRKRSGKGTAAAWLIEKHGYELIKFAEPLKVMLRAFFQQWGLSEATIERLIEGDLKEAPLPMAHGLEGLDASILSQVMMGGKSSRYAMQTLGTEWRDMLSPNLWIDMVDARIRASLNNGRRVVIDDLRFMHEVNRVLEIGGVLIKVTSSRLSDSRDDHSSEQELDDSLFSHIIPNDGTYEKFQQLLDRSILDINPEIT